MKWSLEQDMAMEILQWLPVKSLMRFKCVDRSWNDMLRTPSFTNMHMQQRRHEEDVRLVVFNNQDIDTDNSKCYITLIDPSQSESQRDVECPFPVKSPSTIYPYGPCNGLLCLLGTYSDRRRSQLILWNPATRGVKVLPLPPHYNDRIYIEDVVGGFGADPDTGNFKLVIIVVHRNNVVTDDEFDAPPLDHHIVEIYNLTTNSWTLVSNVTLPDNISCIRNHKRNIGTLANGVCHWLTGKEEEEGSAQIICFDFRNNQFHLLELPTLPTTSQRIISSLLSEVNDSLAYVRDQGNLVQIWIFKHNSWTNYYNLGSPSDDFEIFDLWNDGTQLLAELNWFSWRPYDSPTSLVLFESYTTEPVRDFEVTKSYIGYRFSRLTRFYVRKYVESISHLYF